MNRGTVSAIAMSVLAISCTTAPAASSEGGSYRNVTRIELEGVSGDLTIRPGTGDAVQVRLRESVRPSSAFRGQVRQRGETLRLREDWSGRNFSGEVEWIVEIPASVVPMIYMKSSSGDLSAEGIQAAFQFRSSSGGVRLADMKVAGESSFQTSSGDFSVSQTVLGESVTLHTSSGDVEINRVQAGEGFEFSTSSGDVTIEQSHGVLEGSSSSGNVRVYDTDLSGPSRFTSSSGDVVLQLSRVPSHGLEASSSSGKVRLDAGFGTNFTLIMSKRENRGRIVSPFEVTLERSYRRHGQRYVSQIVRRGSGDPEIRLHTASGEIVVRDNS